MNKLMLLGAIFLAISCASPSGESAASQEEEPIKKEIVTPSLELLWESDTSLITNESVLYYAPDNYLLVSNINGQPLEKDRNGFISKLAADGSIIELNWLEGLDAPKGMGVYDGMLYVTNIDELVEVDLATANVVNRYLVEGAQFLNDVSISEGQVYFSDMATGKLHMLENGQVTMLEEGLTGLNGLAYNEKENMLYMLTAAGLQTRNQEGEISMINDTLTGGDGLILLDDDVYLASRWQGEIWVIINGEATLLLDSKEEEIQTADIGYIPSERLVLVPRFFSNKVSAYRLNY